MSNNTETLSKVLKLADEIRSNRQLLETLVAKLVTQEQWVSELAPKFEQIRQSTNDIVSIVLINNLKENSCYKTSESKKL